MRNHIKYFVVLSFLPACDEVGQQTPDSLRAGLLAGVREDAATHNAFVASALHVAAAADCTIDVEGSQLPARKLELENACAVRDADSPTGCTGTLIVAMDPSVPLSATGSAAELLAFTRPFTNNNTCGAALVLGDTFTPALGLTIESLADAVKSIDPNITPYTNAEFWVVEQSDDEPGTTAGGNRQSLVEAVMTEAASSFALSSTAAQAGASECTIKFEDGSELPAATLTLVDACGLRPGDPNECASGLVVLLSPEVPVATSGVQTPSVAFLRPFGAENDCGSEFVLTSVFVPEVSLPMDEVSAVIQDISPHVLPLSQSEFWTLTPQSDP